MERTPVEAAAAEGLRLLRRREAREREFMVAIQKCEEEIYDGKDRFVKNLGSLQKFAKRHKKESKERFFLRWSRFQNK
jgi:ribosomal protein L31